METIKCADIWSGERYLGTFSRTTKSPYLSARPLKITRVLFVQIFLTEMKILDWKQLKTAWSRSNCLPRQPCLYAAVFELVVCVQAKVLWFT